MASRLTLNKDDATSSRSLRVLQRLRSSYLSFVLSIASLLIAIVNALKELGVPLERVPAVAGGPGTRWLIIILLGLVGVFTLSLRFPKIQVAILRVILHPPNIPANLPRLFRGPIPYDSQDSEGFHGRRADIDECWARIQTDAFFILEGESGSGKSSILNAALVPLARQMFRVIECRVADDPFGKFLAALRQEPYHKTDSTLTTLSASEETAKAFCALTVDTTPKESRKPVLVFFDQFEELFATVSKEIQISFLNVLRGLIEARQCRLVVAIRSDFLDLLIKACRDVEPRSTIFNLGNYHILQSFQPEQARTVLGEILAPLVRDDILLTQRLDRFNAALVAELLRPPTDKRLSRADKLTVLPVELQTVGMVLERFGADTFTAQNLRRLGGKAGLFSFFIEDAKTYVWRKTGVTGDQSLLVLRKLVSPSKTKWSKSPTSIAKEIGMSVSRVHMVLGAFSDKYLVRSIVENGSGYKYELMHEHLVQILTDAPDPILQKARDAEERLKFFTERANAKLYLQTNKKRGSLATAATNLFSQPVSVVDVLKLWRFASSGSSRWILRRSLRGFSFRVLAIVLPLLILSVSWLIWVRSDAYQIRSVLRQAPVLQADAPLPSLARPGTPPLPSGSVVEWTKALATTNHIDAALDVLRQIRDPQARSGAFLTVSAALSESGKMEESRALLDEAVLASQKIVDPKHRSQSLVAIAKALMKNGRTDDAKPVLDAAYAASRNDPAPSFQFIDVANAMLEAGSLDKANNVANEALVQESLTDPQSIGGRGLGGPRLEQFTDLLIRLDRTDDAKVVVAKAGRKLLIKNSELSLEETRVARNALVTLANEMIVLGMKPEAKTLLALALKRVDDLEEDFNREELVTGIAESSAKLADVQMCLNAARLIESDYWSSSGLAIVIRALTSSGQFETAISAAGLTFTEREQALALTDVAEALIFADQVGQALATINLIEVNPYRAEALLIIAKALIKMGKRKEAAEIFHEALNIALKIESDIGRSYQLLALARALSEAGEADQASVVLDHAVAAAHNAGEKSVANPTNFRVQRIQTRPEPAPRRRRSKARDQQRDMLPPGLIADPMYYLVRSLAEAGRANDVLPLVRNSINQDFKASALIAIGAAVKKVGQVDDAKKIFREALLSVNQVQDPKQRGFDLLHLAEEEIELGQADHAGLLLRDALVAINQVRDYSDSYLVVASIAKSFIQIGLRDEAVAAIQSVKGNDLQYYAFSHLLDELRRLPKVDDKRVALLRLLDVANQIHNDNRRSGLVAELAEDLARSHEFRAARLASESCSSTHRLGVYAVILSEYAALNRRREISPSSELRP